MTPLSIDPFVSSRTHKHAHAQSTEIWKVKEQNWAKERRRFQSTMEQRERDLTNVRESLRTSEKVITESKRVIDEKVCIIFIHVGRLMRDR